MARNVRKFLFCTLIAMGMVTGPALAEHSLASAQDDWGVRRDPFDKGLIARYKRILKKKPSDAGALGKLMGMYRRYRSVALLIREYEAELAKKPTFARHMVLGYLHQHAGKADLARAQFVRAARLSPKNAQVHSMLGKLMRDAGQSAEAESRVPSSRCSTQPARKARWRLFALLLIWRWRPVVSTTHKNSSSPTSSSIQKTCVCASTWAMHSFASNASIKPSRSSEQRRGVWAPTRSQK